MPPLVSKISNIGGAAAHPAPPITPPLILNNQWNFSFSVGVHVLVEDVNEFAPKWKIQTGNKEESEEHTLATDVAIEEGQLLEEVTL